MTAPAQTEHKRPGRKPADQSAKVKELALMIWALQLDGCNSGQIAQKLWDAGYRRARHASNP